MSAQPSTARRCPCATSCASPTSGGCGWPRRISDVGDGRDAADPDAAGQRADPLDPRPGRGRDRAGHPAADDRHRRRHLRRPLGPAPDHDRRRLAARGRRPRVRRRRVAPSCCRSSSCWRSSRRRSARSSAPRAARSSRGSSRPTACSPPTPSPRPPGSSPGSSGAGLAGLIVGVAGLTWPAFVIDSITFAVSALLIVGVTAVRRRRRPTRSASRRPASAPRSSRACASWAGRGCSRRPCSPSRSRCSGSAPSTSCSCRSS